MRRIRIFLGCLLLIVAALPLLPGPGALVIAEAVATLEDEFPRLARLLDRASRRRVRPSGLRRPMRDALAHVHHTLP